MSGWKEGCALPGPQLSAAQTAALALLDREVLQDLRNMAGDEADQLLAEVIEMYLQDAPQRLDAIEAAIAQEDAIALAQSAHALRSLSVTVGARGVAQHCQQLEAIGLAGRLPAAAAGRLLRVAFERAADLLQALAERGDV